MTLINRLIKEARNGATELQVPENHVGAVAQHMVDLGVYGGKWFTRYEAERALRKGLVCMAGVPVRIVPKQGPVN